jgi:hypothetical protein
VAGWLPGLVLGAAELDELGAPDVVDELSVGNGRPVGEPDVSTRLGW